jgi:protease IV
VKQFLITIAGVFLGLLLFFVLIPVAFVASMGGSKPATPPQTVLALDLRAPMSDQRPASAFAGLSGGASVVGIVTRLDRAERDSAVKGLFVRAGELGMAPAHAEEIRQAILDFRRSGKFVIAHSQGFDLPTLSNYVAVSGADEIWMQATGDFTATGLVSETMFLGGLFERFGIAAEFEQFYEFKNAADVYTRRDYSEAHREATQSLLGGVYNAFLAAVAVDRKVAVEQLKAALDRAPLAARDAQGARLIDKTGRPEDARDAAAVRAGGVDSATFVDLEDYASGPRDTGPTIAIVQGEGPIVTGSGSDDPFASESIMAGDAIADAIRTATDDTAVKAIVLRVSSPGGSATASDQVWAAVERAKAADKPVVVSMGAYAASGGYYVATNADSIVAMPSTITGSIGVLGGKFAVNEALNRYTGANVSEIAVGGPYATALSGAQRFTNAQRAAYRAAMERIYVDFTGKVAAGRKLPIARVQEIARGRVWTGAQARELGLVDQIGGLRTAIARAKVLADIKPEARVTLSLRPSPGDPLEAFASLLGGGAQAVQGLRLLAAVAGEERVIALVRTLKEQPGVQAHEPLRVR